jgi:anti-anti-sigma factor
VAASPVAVQLLDEQDRSVLRVQGELTASVAADVRSVVADLARTRLLRSGTVVLDMVAVERAHLGGLAVLADAADVVRRRGGGLLLRNLRQQPRHMRHVLRLQRDLPLEDEGG